MPFGLRSVRLQLLNIEKRCIKIGHTRRKQLELGVK